jgi:hypothetical protein
VAPHASARALSLERRAAAWPFSWPDSLTRFDLQDAAGGLDEILTVPFARPRDRAAVLEDPEYYRYHRQVIDFLENHARQLRVTTDAVC